MHETQAITVTEVIKSERLGNRSGARHCRAWIHLYITRGKEEDKGMAKSNDNWSSRTSGTESKRRFLGAMK
jgi:hypothetical protein